MPAHLSRSSHLRTCNSHQAATGVRGSVDSSPYKVSRALTALSQDYSTGLVGVAPSKFQPDPIALTRDVAGSNALSTHLYVIDILGRQAQESFSHLLLELLGASGLGGRGVLLAGELDEVLRHEAGAPNEVDH